MNSNTYIPAGQSHCTGKQNYIFKCLLIICFSYKLMKVGSYQQARYLLFTGRSFHMILNEYAAATIQLVKRKWVITTPSHSMESIPAIPSQCYERSFHFPHIFPVTQLRTIWYDAYIPISKFCHIVLYFLLLQQNCPPTESRNTTPPPFWNLSQKLEILIHTLYYKMEVCTIFLIFPSYFNLKMLWSGFYF